MARSMLLNNSSPISLRQRHDPTTHHQPTSRCACPSRRVAPRCRVVQSAAETVVSDGQLKEGFSLLTQTEQLLAQLATEHDMTDVEGPATEMKTLTEQVSRPQQ